MSYILDALKKSEKKRALGTVPALPVSQNDAQKKIERRSLWTYVIIGALMINVVALVLWFEPWHSKKTALTVAQAPVDTQSPAIETKPAYATPGIKGKEDGGKNEIKTKAALEKTALNRNNNAQLSESAQIKENIKRKIPDKTAQADRMNMAQEIPPAAPQHPQESPNVQTEHKPEVSNIIPNPVPNKIYNFSELPLLLQQKLPSFVISAFIYSNEANSRMVKVNGKRMTESQDLSEGIKLEEIKPDGIVLSYMNYRFWVGLK
jgi:general secretion pathway protein B